MAPQLTSDDLPPTVGSKGSDLIFLLSQPRSGSTMLQRILGGHPDIHTQSEPWLMLHPFYALRDHGYEAEYESRLARLAVREFLDSLPGGEDDYYEGVRRMYGYLYSKALEGTHKRFFLDKDPRYHLVADDLVRTFPDATFIFLTRNPLSVLASIVRYWRTERVPHLWRHHHDLLEAPKSLLDAADSLGERALRVRYEDVVGCPEFQVQRICERIGVPFESSIISYGDTLDSKWAFGDKRSVHMHQTVVSDYTDSWKDEMKKPQSWRLAGDYLDYLGADLIERMGYSFNQLAQQLEGLRPLRISLIRTRSLGELVVHPDERSAVLRRIKKFRELARRRGVINATVVAMRSLVMRPFKARS